MALNRRQALFVEHYLRLNNASRAAIEAGYSPRSASNPSRLLKHPEIAARVRERTEEALQALKLDADEVLARMAEIARGAMPLFASVNDRGRVEIRARDVEAARANLHLVRRVVNTPTKSGMRYEIEVLDPLVALNTLAKHYRLIDRASEGNWREELAKAGVDPKDVYEAIVEQVERRMRAGEA